MLTFYYRPSPNPGARPASARANALKDRHAFKMEIDEEARRHRFPQNLISSA